MADRGPRGDPGQREQPVPADQNGQGEARLTRARGRLLPPLVHPTSVTASRWPSDPPVRPARRLGSRAMSPEDIRHDSVLPARRQDIELHTADGLTLVGELALPLDRAPVATLVTVHPLPTHGGFMDSHVLRKAAARLPALADLAVLRFNLRGVSSPRGTSQGTFDEGVAERFDVAAAIEFAEFSELPHPWLLGWSFGTDLILRYGCDPGIEGAILLSPPLRSAVDHRPGRLGGVGQADVGPGARARRLPAPG